MSGEECLLWVGAEEEEVERGGGAGSGCAFSMHEPQDGVLSLWGRGVLSLWGRGVLSLCRSS